MPIFSFGQQSENNGIDNLDRQKIDSLFEQWDNDSSPGAAIGIIGNGELLYSKNYGLANLDYQIPISNNSKFYIASTTKQFTAPCIVLLSLERKIGFDDNIRDYLPEIPDYGETITIRHLIHHTSGLRDYLRLMYLAGKSFEDYFSIDDGIKKIEKQKTLNFSPGEEFSYSNSGYILLAEIVNRASGMTIRQYAEKNIFQPLGMENTFFNDDNRKVIKDRVISYHRQDDDSYKTFLQNFDALGDGNLLTTVNDLFLWDQNFYNRSVGGNDFNEIMISRGVLNSGDTLDYAFGLEHGTHKGLKTISHSGGMLGFSTEYIRFPEQHFSIIVLANRSDANAYLKVFQIADILLTDLFLEVPQSKEIEQENLSDTITEDDKIILPNLNLEDYTGNYYSEELNVNYLFFTENGKLKSKIHDKPLLMDCTINNIDEFAMEYRLVRFQRTDGQVSGFEIDFGRIKNLKFFKK